MIIYFNVLFSIFLIKLPIHIILRNRKADRAAVRALMTFYPECISCADCNGNLPLTLALTSSCSASLIETLIADYPIATQKMNTFGTSPLFLALKYDAADRIVMNLIEHGPEVRT